jgi:hypothetical protein
MGTGINCCFQAFEDSPTGEAETEPEFTCVHGRTLKWGAARRALELKSYPYARSEVGTCGRKATVGDTQPAAVAGNC